MPSPCSATRVLNWILLIFVTTLNARAQVTTCTAASNELCSVEARDLYSGCTTVSTGSCNYGPVGSYACYSGEIQSATTTGCENAGCTCSDGVCFASGFNWYCGASWACPNDPAYQCDEDATHFDLSGCGILTDDDIQDLSTCLDTAGREGITGLYLNNNGLTTVPAGLLSGLTALTTISFKNNALTSLPDGLFAGLTAIQNIDLEENQLTTLPEGLFAGLTALTTIYLNNNGLTTVPAGLLTGLTALTTMSLADNPDLTCKPSTEGTSLSSITGASNLPSCATCASFDGTCTDTAPLSDGTDCNGPTCSDTHCCSATCQSFSEGCPSTALPTALPDATVCAGATCLEADCCGGPTPAPTIAPTPAPTPVATALQDDDGMMERCASEYTACAEDADCSTCYDDAVADDTCPETADVATCADIGDHYCCAAGEACGDNDLLVALVNCQVNLDGCTLTELCSNDGNAGGALDPSARWGVGIYIAVGGAVALGVMP